MGIIELFILAVGLSMDAFAVAICKGLCLKKITFKKAGIVGLYFGAFQAGMPLIGYFLGVQFKDKITSLDHWIAFALLGFIGVSMIRESIESSAEMTAEAEPEMAVGSVVNNCNCVCSTDETEDNPLSFKKMSVMAIATSIDALAVGVTFAFLDVNVSAAVAFIGIVTFTLSMIGVKIGNVFGTIYKAKAEFAGGFILILMGLKILFEHLGIINF